MQTSRRQFVKTVMAAPAFVIPMRYTGTRPRVEGQDTPLVRSERVIQGIADFRLGGRAGLRIAEAGVIGLALEAGTQDGSYVSPTLPARFPFSAVALKWRAGIPVGTSLSFFVRTSEDSQRWTDWQAADEIGDTPASAGPGASDLVGSHGQYIQWAASFHTDTPASPALVETTVIYFDSAEGTTVDLAGARTVRLAPADGVSAPTIISRAGWGCPQPNSSPAWPPEYHPIEKIIIHHTASTNNYTDGASWVRTVWRYHTVDQGWGDIGYNYLVDRFGHIYEGRYGGLDVIAGHARCYNPGSAGIAVIGTFDNAAVPAAAQAALVSLMAWLAYRRDLYPYARSYFIDRELPNISGHRDVLKNTTVADCYMNKTCPGAYLYAQINTAQPSLRDRVWSGYPEYGAGWLDHDVPAVLTAGQTARVHLSLVNRGRLTWSQGGSNAVRVHYRWYRADGTEYAQAAAGDRRASLPADIAYADKADVEADLLVPGDAGSYTLRWDLELDRVAEFSTQGVTPLSIPVDVRVPTLAVDRQTVTFLVDPSTEPPPQRVAISTGAVHAWTAASDQSWCHLSATDGETPGLIILSVDKKNIKSGKTYTATVTVKAEGVAASPQRVVVHVVYAAKPLHEVMLPVVHGQAH